MSVGRHHRRVGPAPEDVLGVTGGVAEVIEQEFEINTDSVIMLSTSNDVSGGAPRDTISGCVSDPTAPGCPAVQSRMIDTRE